MILQPSDVGWIEVICGPMFSGKTEELIRRLKRAQYARQRVQVFKPSLDDRYDTQALMTHDRVGLEGQAVGSLAELMGQLDPQVEVVGIDEIQFFGAEIIAVSEDLANRGCRVVLAGLDLDWRGEPFGLMPQLICRAEYVTKLMSICMRCGNPAHYSFRLASDPQQVLVGSSDQYEALCRRCFYVSPNAPQQEGPPGPEAAV